MSYQNYDVHLQRTTVERARVPIRAQTPGEAVGLAIAKGKTASTTSWAREPGRCGVFMTSIEEIPEPKADRLEEIERTLKQGVDRLRMAEARATKLQNELGGIHARVGKVIDRLVRIEQGLAGKDHPEPAPVPAGWDEVEGGLVETCALPGTLPDWFAASVQRMRAAGCTVNVTIEGEDLPS